MGILGTVHYSYTSFNEKLMLSCFVENPDKLEYPITEENAKNMQIKTRKVRLLLIPFLIYYSVIGPIFSSIAIIELLVRMILHTLGELIKWVTITIASGCIAACQSCSIEKNVKYLQGIACHLFILVITPIMFFPSVIYELIYPDKAVRWALASYSSINGTETNPLKPLTAQSAINY